METGVSFSGLGSIPAGRTWEAVGAWNRIGAGRQAGVNEESSLASPGPARPLLGVVVYPFKSGRSNIRITHKSGEASAHYLPTHLCLC